MTRATHLSPSWQDCLSCYLTADTWSRLDDLAERLYAQAETLPPRDCLYAAYAACPPEQTRVVILGQDPYPTPGDAHGLCFSVSPTTPLPRSLQNLFAERTADLGLAAPNNGNLMDWAHQGVLMLNAILTVRAHAPLSHKGLGWECLTDMTIRAVSDRQDHCVFMLWGKAAQAKAPLINTAKHLIIASAHPSPLSARRGFFGSRPFSRANDFLSAHGLAPIAW